MHILALLATLTVSVMIGGCIQESIEFPTGNFTTETTILSDEEETTVTTTLRINNNLPYTLHKTDALTSDYNGDIKSMTRANTNAYYKDDNVTFSLSSSIGARQVFSSKYEGDLTTQEILVSFNRADDISYQSSVRIPEASNILSPKTQAIFSSDQDITVTWDNASISQTVTLNFQTECSEHEIIIAQDSRDHYPIGSDNINMTFIANDTGSVVVPMVDILDIRSHYDAYLLNKDTNPDLSFNIERLDCQTELFIIRDNEGIVDQGLNDNSKITAKTSRKMAGSFQILLKKP